MQGRTNPEFWRGRRVLLTGHTGFKGAWLARWLRHLGATVFGVSLPPQTEPSLHLLLGTELAGEWLQDLRNPEAATRIMAEARPDILLHLAAQSLVPESYRDPLGTWSSNLIASINLLEALRRCDWPVAALMITTDKVYANDERDLPFPEDAPLGGDDPYSASKAAVEIAVHSWKKSFLNSMPLATARAGNVIGGGDWSADRLIPDIVRAARAGTAVVLRRPEATRPWQHVLDPLHGYLLYAEALYARQPELPAALNFGPLQDGKISAGQIATALTNAFGASAWRHEPQPGIGEKGTLAIDARLAVASLGWRPVFSTQAALDATVAWYKAWLGGADPAALTDRQIADYQRALAGNAPAGAAAAD